MHLKTLLPFIPIVSAFPTLYPRETTQETSTALLNQDVQNINTAVLSLTNTVSKFSTLNIPITLIDGISVLTGVAEIHLVNRAGYVHALAAPVLNATESETIISTVQDTVTISIPASISALEAKKADFEEAGFGATVVASLELLLSDHDSFSAAVEAKFMGSEDELAAGETAVKTIHDAIEAGIEGFSS